MDSGYDCLVRQGLHVIMEVEQRPENMGGNLNEPRVTVNLID